MRKVAERARALVESDPILYSASHAAIESVRTAVASYLRYRRHYVMGGSLAEQCARFPARNANLSYGPEARRVRGRQRAARLHELFSETGEQALASHASVLEVGANDGQVMRHLAMMGYTATGIDLTKKSPLPEVEAQARFIGGVDACGELPFSDASFDVVYSLNCFEHFSDPAAALAQMARVTKAGGIIHLSFAPLYWSPFGLHAYKWVSLPYCQFLYSQEELDAYCVERHGSPLSTLAPYVNGWSATQYRLLWKRFSDRLRVIRSRESINRDHELIVLQRLDPSNDDFFVHGIEITFRRSAEA